MNNGVAECVSRDRLLAARLRQMAAVAVASGAISRKSAALLAAAAKQVVKRVGVR